MHDGYTDLTQTSEDTSSTLDQKCTDLRALDRKTDRLNKGFYQVAKHGFEPGSDAFKALNDKSNASLVGAPGPQGPRGDQDPAGDPVGPQGPPAEVTNAQLVAAISGTSSNTNGIKTLDAPYAQVASEELR